MNKRLKVMPAGLVVIGLLVGGNQIFEDKNNSNIVQAKTTIVRKSLDGGLDQFIPDANLRDQLIKAVAKKENIKYESVTEYDIVDSLDYFVIEGNAINNMSGFKIDTNIGELDIESSQLQSIISSIKNLKDFNNELAMSVIVTNSHLSKDDLKDLKKIVEETDISELKLDNVVFPDLISKTDFPTNLKSLTINNSHLTSHQIESGFDLPKLEVLNLSSNDLKDIDFYKISDIKLLEYLNLNNNKLTTIEGLRNANTPNLKSWHFNNNHLQDFTPLQGYRFISLIDGEEDSSAYDQTVTIDKTFTKSDLEKTYQIDVQQGVKNSITLNDYDFSNMKVVSNFRNEDLSYIVDSNDRDHYHFAPSLFYDDPEDIQVIDQYRTDQVKAFSFIASLTHKPSQLEFDFSDSLSAVTGTVTYNIKWLDSDKSSSNQSDSSSSGNQSNNPSLNSGSSNNFQNSNFDIKNDTISSTKTKSADVNYVGGYGVLLWEQASNGTLVSSGKYQPSNSQIDYYEDNFKVIDGIKYYRIGNQNYWIQSQYLKTMTGVSSDTLTLLNNNSILLAGNVPYGIFLRNSLGDMTKQIIQPETLWRVFEKKIFNGHAYYRLGNDNQWLEDTYVKSIR